MRVLACVLLTAAACSAAKLPTIPGLAPGRDRGGQGRQIFGSIRSPPPSPSIDPRGYLPPPVSCETKTVDVTRTVTTTRTTTSIQQIRNPRVTITDFVTSTRPVTVTVTNTRTSIVPTTLFSTVRTTQ
ncbi:uncharacterized protein LOC143022798, partial [Oratosquilla oratoria]